MGASEALSPLEKYYVQNGHNFSPKRALLAKKFRDSGIQGLRDSGIQEVFTELRLRI